ncbi:hypothetical protein AT727_05945 [Desulfitobacterium hafniense]|uniref:Molybdopterin dinucleotide-binding domain-containing protein n=1 Tax=Desulfitobacterium hafniense TaxID=49338 RepID=A0A0W1JHA5_DESHA|nr:molybdopterin dinucleotide binding domain-containing protein [Desulfitobacterium hafniense]KTE91137.1 hypothetical protein AT727_05945 [Desulfitobacterium hafniense]
MGSMEGILITVRTSKQGAAMEKGKFSEEYRREIASLTLNPDDFARLQLGEEKRALLKSGAGEVEVICRAAEGPQGIFFLPLGAVANELLDEETHGTGVPDFKGIPVRIAAIAQDKEENYDDHS